jgi:hypothetical protein
MRLGPASIRQLATSHLGLASSYQFDNAAKPFELPPITDTAKFQFRVFLTCARPGFPNLAQLWMLERAKGIEPSS